MVEIKVVCGVVMFAFNVTHQNYYLYPWGQTNVLNASQNIYKAIFKNIL